MSKDLFQQAGIAFPSRDWTWDDYIAAARALGQLPGITGSEFVTWPVMVRTYLRTEGCEAIDDGLTNIRVDEPAAGAPVAAVRGGYLLPFEIVSVHLLVVLVGAAYLARAKRRRTPRAIDVAASSVGPVVTARQAARSSASALVSGGGR